MRRVVASIILATSAAHAEPTPATFTVGIDAFYHPLCAGCATSRYTGGGVPAPLDYHRYVLAVSLARPSVETARWSVGFASQFRIGVLDSNFSDEGPAVITEPVLGGRATFGGRVRRYLSSAPDSR